jgi:translation initiation factor eIF-2B subunit gamma
LLRLPEVQTAIKSDFILLPCDLICDIPGESLLEAWMVSQAALSGSAEEQGAKRGSSAADLRGEKAGRRGGLGVWYQTRDREESVKGEVADFVGTATLDKDEAPVVYPPVDGHGSIRYNLSKLVYAMPMDSLKEKMEEDKGLLIRHSLVNKHARVKLLTTYRDAHIYIFGYMVKEFAKRNEKFQSISEDLVGWWAKTEWQEGLGEKLGLREILEGSSDDYHNDNASHDGDAVEDEVDLQAMSTTKSGGSGADKSFSDDLTEPQFASRVNTMASESDLESAAVAKSKKKSKLNIPPMLAYIHSSLPSAPMVRRVDNSALLLSVSLKLAKLESIEEVGRAGSSPFAHAAKIAYPAGVAQRCTVTKHDCLIAENVTVEEKCVIKETVIGANCHIESGARLTRCLIMDGAVVGARCQLTGCIVGRRSKIGRECVLKDCEVQDGNAVPDETDAKNEKFMVFEGLDTEDGDEDGMSLEDDNDLNKFDEGGADLGF